MWKQMNLRGGALGRGDLRSPRWPPTCRSREGQEGAERRRRLTYHPLDPDHIVRLWLGAEVLEAAAKEVPHSLALLAQVGLGLDQEVLRHVHHVHHSEERQEQPLGDPPDAGSAVQGVRGPCPVWAFLQQQSRHTEEKG